MSQILTTVYVRVMVLVGFVILMAGFGVQPGIAQSGKDVTAQVETVGNPFTQHYPDGDLIYARNVWGMQVFADRLYLGSGNANNDGPAPNAGPVDIWAYDGQNFNAEYTVNDEQVDHFDILNGDLYAAGYDTMSAQQVGNFYHLINGEWEAHSNILQAAHVFDLASYQGHMFAATAATGPNGEQGQAIGVSDDGGETWTGLNLLAAHTDSGDIYEQVAWEFVPVGNDLLVSAQPLILLVQADDGSVQRKTYGGVLHEYQNGAFVPLNVDPFPGYKVDPSKAWAQRMARAVPFMNGTVYVGALVQGTGFNWIPFGLYSIQAASDSFAAKRLPISLPMGYTWDTLVDNGVLYVLGGACTPEGGFNSPCTVTVASTCDLQSWNEVLQFQSDTFARSFALYRGDFYFGMGTDASNLSPDAGDILRVPQSAFQLGCQG